MEESASSYLTKFKSRLNAERAEALAAQNAPKITQVWHLLNRLPKSENNFSIASMLNLGVYCVQVYREVENHDPSLKNAIFTFLLFFLEIRVNEDSNRDALRDYNDMKKDICTILQIPYHESAANPRANASQNDAIPNISRQEEREEGDEDDTSPSRKFSL